MKHKRLYVVILLAILGIAVIGVSMTMPYSKTKAILGVVLGGVLIQAGIATFVIDWSEVRRPAHRRRRR
jgi:phosphate/sulfate permease